MRRHWLLPEVPDVPALLGTQIGAALRGMHGLALWADGSFAHAEQVGAARHESESARQGLHEALRTAFVADVAPESAYAISRAVATLLDHAGDLVREAEVMDCAPDPELARMADALVHGLEHVAGAVAALHDAPDRCSRESDAALADVRAVEHGYRRAMGALLDCEDLHEIIARRELYRRAETMGDTLQEIAERVVYAELKER